MWLPWGRAATQGRPYKNSRNVQGANFWWFALVTWLKEQADA